MPRRKIINSHDYPYHITARANNKEWFYLEKYHCWQIFSKKLNEAHKKFQLQIYAFVLMCNHYHLLAMNKSEHNLGVIMHWLQSSVGKTINKITGRINHVFGGPYKASLVTKDIYYAHVLKYIYRNPVRAGICNDVQDYSYSTLNSPDIIINSNKTDISSYVPKNKKDFLKWLNSEVPEDYDLIIRKSLKKSEMLIKTDSNRKPNIMNYQIF